MRRPVGSRGQQRLSRFEQPHGAVDAGRFDRLGGREPRQDRGDALGEHGLAGAGWSEHQQVVIPGGGDRHGPLGHLLAADVGKVDVVGRVFFEPLVQPRRGGIDVDRAGEEGHGLSQARHGNHLDAFHHGGFGRAGGRHHEAGEPLLARGGHRHRQRPAGRPRRAVEGQLSDHGVAIEPVGHHLPATGQQAQGNRQVERRGLLRQFRRGEVDHHPIIRPQEARVHHRPLDAVRAFLDRRLGKSDQNRFGKCAGRDVHLHLDRHRLDADQRKRAKLGEHGCDDGLVLPDGRTRAPIVIVPQSLRK